MGLSFAISGNLTPVFAAILMPLSSISVVVFATLSMKFIARKMASDNMSVIIILILISATVASTFLIAFIWSVKSGQYDDTYSPSVRMLFDDEVVRRKDKKESDTGSKSS